jgi:hypothetical protein
MLAQEQHSSTAVAGHLAEQAAKARAGVVSNHDTGRKEAAKAGSLHAVVEFHVLAGIEIFVKQADCLEYRSAIRDGHALRSHKALGHREIVRLRLMAQPRRSPSGDGSLQNRSSRDI